MQLHDALGLLTTTTAIVNLGQIEMVMLALADEPEHDMLEMTRVDLASATVKEAFDFADYQHDLVAVLDEIMTYAIRHGFDNARWEQLDI